MYCNFRQKYIPVHVKEHVTVFPLEQGLSEHSTMLRSTWIASLYILNINRFKMYIFSA